MGGDGSVNEVVNGVGDLDGFDLGVLPYGTGWDFVRTYGISRRLEDSVATVLAANVREIDLGLVTYRTWAGAEGRAFFANVGSAGISGAIARRANETSKALGGKVSYYWATLAVFVGWEIGELRVSIDDEIRGGRMVYPARDAVQRVLERGVRDGEPRLDVGAEEARMKTAEAAQRAESVPRVGGRGDGAAPVRLDPELRRGEGERGSARDERHRLVCDACICLLELRGGRVLRHSSDVDARDMRALGELRR